MSYEEGLRSLSLNADASLAGYTGAPGAKGSADPNDGKALYRFVRISGANQVGLVTQKGQKAFGVCQSKPQVAGEAATIGIRGVSNVIVGAAISAGDELTSDQLGRAVPAVSLGAEKTVSGTLSVTTGVVTVTCTAHGFVVGDRIKITGATTAANNGEFIVKTVADANTFTIDNALAVQEAAAGGNATKATKITLNGVVHAVALKGSSAVGSLIPARLTV